MRRFCRRSVGTFPGELSYILKELLFKGWDNRDAIQKFEVEFASMTQINHAVCSASGRLAILTALKESGLRKGSSIVIPAYTLGPLADMLHEAGYRLILCDVNSKDAAMHPDHLKLLPNSESAYNADAVLLTHPFGMPVNMDAWNEYFEKVKPLVIQDCAHALLSRWKNRALANPFENTSNTENKSSHIMESIDDSSHIKANCYSLEFTKGINTFGGGMITTSDQELKRKLHNKLCHLPLIRSAIIKKMLIALTEIILEDNPAIYSSFTGKLLSSEELSHQIINVYRSLKKKSKPVKNRYSGLQASIGLKALTTASDSLANRKAVAEVYRKRLSHVFHFQKDNHVYGHSWTYAVGILNDRYCNKLFSRNIRISPAAYFSAQARKFGVDTGHSEQIMHHIGNRLSNKIRLNYSLPGADSVFSKAVMLPMYDSLTSDQAHIISTRIIRHVCQR